MGEPQPNVQLQMVWPEQLLSKPPIARAAAGYHLRTYREGDEARFFEVMAQAGWPGWNMERLEPWLARILSEGWFFAVHVETGEIVATAMAVHDPTPLHPFGGELGWVACDTAHRGKHLGMAVCAAVTDRLLAASYRDIHLYTEDWRLPALKTYLQLGYVPLLFTPEMPERWRAICEQLNWPFTPDEWRG